MGYSHTIVTETPEKRQKMLTFLRARMPAFKAIHPVLWSCTESNWEDGVTLRVPYRRNLTLGYAVLGSGTQHYPLLEVLKWAAHKVGERVPANTLKARHPRTDREMVPYLLFDGLEKDSAEPIPNLNDHWAKRAAAGEAQHYKDKRELWNLLYPETPFYELQTIHDMLLKNLEADWNNL